MTEQIESETALLRETYAAFNARDIDSALARMTRDVKWPRAFKGGFVRGPDAIRDYWTEQWREIDPTVDPVSFSRKSDSTVLVEVRQLVRDMNRKVLADSVVGHLFTFENGLIDKMEIYDFPKADV